MTEPDAEEWITIPEAAQRLQIGERQARRLVNRLPESERTPEGVRPAKVKWCPANVRQMGGKLSGLSETQQNGPDMVIEPQAPEPPETTILLPIAPDHATEQPDPDVEMSGLMSENGPDTPNVVRTDQSALIAQYELRIADKNAEIAFLRSELTATRQAGEIADRENRRLLLAALPPPAIPPPARPDPIDEAIAAGRPAAPHRNWLQAIIDRLRGRKP